MKINRETELYKLVKGAAETAVIENNSIVDVIVKALEYNGVIFPVPNAAKEETLDEAIEAEYALIDIRKEARSKGVPLWQIAKHLGISEPTMTRKLRNPSAMEKKKMLDAIEHIQTARIKKGEYDALRNL